MPQTACDPWPLFSPAILPQLNVEDDPAFWQTAIRTILADTEAAAATYSKKECLLVEIGCCSHWIRPHWRTRNGIAWPYGYKDKSNSYNFSNLPAYDWSLQWMLNPKSKSWQPFTRHTTRRPLIHRIALPARTQKHPQATVHTIWTPGSPTNPKHKLTRAYGFKKKREGWQLFAEFQREHN